jgi:peroxygenase
MQKGWIPHPLFPIYLDRVHRTKHGSDTGVYDHEGRFIPFAFEEIFSKFDRDNKGGLSWNDIQEVRLCVWSQACKASSCASNTALLHYL